MSRGQEFLDNREGYRLKKEKGINFLDYYQSYISSYTKKYTRAVDKLKEDAINS